MLHESLTHKKKLKKVKVVILSYIDSWRPVCSIPDIVSKQGRTKNEMRCSLLVELSHVIVQKQKEGAKEGRQAGGEPGHHQVN